MKERGKPIAYSALCAALGSILLYFASVFPSGRLFVMCISSVCVVFIACRFGWKWGGGCFIVTAAISLLILPAKAMAILYAAFFGYYPLFFLLTERSKKMLVRYAFRLGLFNTVVVVLYCAARSVFPSDMFFGEEHPIVMLLLANIFFLIYDYALQQGMLYFMRNIARRIK